MFIRKGLIPYIFLIPIVVLILICHLAGQKATESRSIGYEVPIYKISISESTQRDIWKLCEENHLSYETVLALYQVEGDTKPQIDNIKADIENLVYFRDYWTEQGFPDEIVFELMLLSRQSGIEGCMVFIKDSDSYDLDTYVQKVTEYKYYLEQIYSNHPNNNELVADQNDWKT